MQMHPLQKAQQNLSTKVRALSSLLDLRKAGVALAGPDIVTTVQFLELKSTMDQMVALASAGAVDDTAQISTTLTEGMVMLQAEGLVLAEVPAWRPWAGGLCPVPMGTIIDVKFRDGRTREAVEANNWDDEASEPHWRHDGISNDIVAYRVSVGAELEATQADKVAA